MACDLDALLAANCALRGFSDRALREFVLIGACSAGSGPATCTFQEGAGSPVGSVTPDFIGQLYHRTSDDTYWRSTGLTNVDWAEISGGGACSNTLASDAATMDNLVITDDESIENVLLPLLVTKTGDFQFQGCTALAVLDLSALQTVGELLVFQSALTTFALPALINCDTLIFNNNGSLTSCNLGTATFTTRCAVQVSAALTSVAATAFSFVDGCIVDFPDNALNVASIDHILARCVASALTTSAIDLSGGTNATPGAQGQIDKTALITAGCTCTTN